MDERFPPSLYRRMPKWSTELPKDIAELMDEVYAALQSDSRRLATMGARTIFDLMAGDQLGLDAGSFQNKLDQLVRIGLVSPHQRGVLEAALEAGNAAAHRGFKPDEGSLSAVIDIVEQLLWMTYIQKPRADELRRATPSDPRRSQDRSAPSHQKVSRIPNRTGRNQQDT